MELAVHDGDCPECGGRLQKEANETVCGACGLVLTERAIDRGPEWNGGDEETDRRRTGAPLERSRHDRGLSTEIGYGRGAEVSGSRQRRLVRMRKHHSRARFSSKRERNRAYGFTEIRRLVSSLSLPVSIREQSCSLFETAQKEGLLCGRSLEGFSAAAIYASCRVESISRTIDEVVDVARADRNELKTAYTAMNRELGLPIGAISPEEYLPRYSSELEVSAEVERRARDCVSRLRDAGGIGGKNPSGVAAACLYRAARAFDDDVTQTDAAELADVSRMTIRSTLTDCERLLDE